MPPGWFVFDVGDPDATWNAVITNVTQITFFYGDPTFLFFDDIWNTGADNVRNWSAGLPHVATRLIPGNDHAMAIYYNVREEVLAFIQKLKIAD